MTTVTRKPGDQPFEARHGDAMDWQTQRFEGVTSRMLFHPRPERPTEPNAGIVRYAPGYGHPAHRHDFAQIWYILEGTFKIGRGTYGPGSMLFHPDPHFEEALSTETGGDILYVQYQGPTTGRRPVYDGRFNMKERTAEEAARLDV